MAIADWPWRLVLLRRIGRLETSGFDRSISDSLSFSSPIAAVDAVK
jgi:hypothetical protein